MFDVEPYDDDHVLISLDVPISPWPPQGWVVDQTNVDVVLLSRNIAIVGGLLTIYRTPTVAQIVNGIEFRRNFTGSQLLSPVIDFSRCEQNEASIVSENAIIINGSPVLQQITPNLELESTAPTNAPTSAPSKNPVSLCQDDTSFRFKQKNRRRCRWIGLNAEKRCKKKHLEGKLVSEFCPKTCGKC